MVDDLKNRGPQDRSRINTNEDWEVQWWSKELGCTPDELRQAVRQAQSSSVDKVRAYLKK